MLASENSLDCFLSFRGNSFNSWVWKKNWAWAALCLVFRLLSVAVCGEHSFPVPLLSIFHRERPPLGSSLLSHCCLTQCAEGWGVTLILCYSVNLLLWGKLACFWNSLVRVEMFCISLLCLSQLIPLTVQSLRAPAMKHNFSLQVTELQWRSTASSLWLH